MGIIIFYGTIKKSIIDKNYYIKEKRSNLLKEYIYLIKKVAERSRKIEKFINILKLKQSKIIEDQKNILRKDLKKLKKKIYIENMEYIKKVININEKKKDVMLRKELCE